MVWSARSSQSLSITDAVVGDDNQAGGSRLHANKDVQAPEGVEKFKETTAMTAPSTNTGVIMTDAAASKAKALIDQEGRDDLALRIAVQPGGCSGLRYQLYFDDRALDGDKEDEVGGVRLVVDKMSTPYLLGAQIDFSDTIEAQGFTIDNPNAGSSCACGDSFN